MLADVLENLLMWPEKSEGTEHAGGLRFDCTCYPMGMTGMLQFHLEKNADINTNIALY